MIPENLIKSYPWLELLVESTPDNVDLTNELQSIQLDETVKMLLDQGISIDDLDAIEADLIPDADITMTFVLLAFKVLRARLIVNEIREDLHVSVLFAVYKEHIRIQKSSVHPHGEDFLRRKVSQLRSLFHRNASITWDLTVVDDGCPENTGNVAEGIISEEGWDNVKVIYLQDAIDQGLPPANDLSSTSDSQKGGSVEYGMWNAVQSGPENQIVVFTDADLSTHLGQTGLLLDPIINRGKGVAIGSRREEQSVVLKQGSRNTRGKLFIYLWKRLLPILNEIIDTQAGFKAFNADTVKTIIDDLIEKKFAFDIELLLKAELWKSGSIEKVAIAWIDSEAASTTTDIQPYLSMLKAIVQMYRKYLPKNESSEPFAELIEGLDQDMFDQMLENIPTGILEREPLEYSDYNGVSAEELRNSVK